MDNFAQLPSDERRLYFEQTAAKLGLTAMMIEKDFWVCWSLRRLFLLNMFRGHLTFKGGTSLSKVYGLIERFSEDIDISIDRVFLGFGGDEEPERGQSGKEQQRRIEKLKQACQHAVIEQILPQLNQAISQSLGGDVGWKLSLDSTDPDQQTLKFVYPQVIDETSPYFAASVKIELGARSDHFPVEDATITPYVHDVFPDALADSGTHVQVLTAVRTFWEKATILHMLHHQPAGKITAPRMSRHYYDMYQLARSDVKNQALNSLDLLARVAVHKQVFFKAAWAKYQEAKPGTLKLTPAKHIVKSLRTDYQEMSPMFFSEPPLFEEILGGMTDLEKEINQSGDQ